jgi:hypothetical protein
MFLNYNDVELELEHVAEFSVKPIMSSDGVDVLYDEYLLAVTAVWSPAATGAPNKAAVSLGSLPALLSEPRKLLIFRVPNSPGGETIVLQSPLNRPGDLGIYPTDAAQGPMPQFVKVEQLAGEKLAIVTFAIKTWVVPCTSARLCVSNRWEMTHDVSRDHALTTRTIVGEAVMRADLVTATNTCPDALRGSVIPAVPYGFQRLNERTTQSSDNTRLSYTIVDEQQQLLIGQGYQGITRIEGTYSDHYGIGAFSLARAVQSAESGSIIGSIAGSVFPGMGNAIGSIFGGIVGFGAEASGVLPARNVTMLVRVWGESTCPRFFLVQALARAVASYNMGVSTFVERVRNNFIVQSWATVDIFDKYAELILSYEASGITNLGLQLVGLAPPKLLPNAETIPDDIGPVARVLSQSQFTTTPFYNDNGTRGYVTTQLESPPAKTTCDPAVTTSQNSLLAQPPNQKNFPLS